MRQTVKIVVPAPMKIREPLFIGFLVALLVACNLAAGSRLTLPNPLAGLSLFQAQAPAHQPVDSIDD